MPQPVGRTRRGVLLALAAIVVAVVAAIVVVIRPAPVSIVEARVSLDGDRLELALDSCNADIQVDVKESDDTVVLDVTRSDNDWFGGDDCLDLVYVNLDRPIGPRDIRDASSETSVTASQSVSGIGDEPEGPFDRSRVSEADYEAALRAMVECLERGDPDVTAQVVELLNWKTYEWTKPAINGTEAIDDEVLETCEREHLEPVR